MKAHMLGNFVMYKIDNTECVMATDAAEALRVLNAFDGGDRDFEDSIIEPMTRDQLRSYAYLTDDIKSEPLLDVFERLFKTDPRPQFVCSSEF